MLCVDCSVLIQYRTQFLFVICYIFLLRQLAKDRDKVIDIATKFLAKEVMKQVIDVCKSASHVDVLDKRRGKHPTAIFLSDLF